MLPLLLRKLYSASYSPSDGIVAADSGILLLSAVLLLLVSETPTSFEGFQVGMNFCVLPAAPAAQGSVCTSPGSGGEKSRANFTLVLGQVIPASYSSGVLTSCELESGASAGACPRALLPMLCFLLLLGAPVLAQPTQRATLLLSCMHADEHA